MSAAAPFDPAKIERELAVLEREKSGSGTRATLFNLAVFAPEEAAGRIESLLAFLLGKRAARVIRVVLDAPGASRVGVSARCVPDREDRGVCFQEILVENGPDNAGIAPGTWPALLVRDIPVYAVWLEALGARPELLEQLGEFADKLIIDSEYSTRRGDEPAGMYRRILDYSRRHVLAVSDFAWRRTAGARIQTARLFDEVEDEDVFDKIGTVRLAGFSPAAARLYKAWLTGRLGWLGAGPEYRNENGGRVSFVERSESAAGSLEITFAAGPGRDLKVRLDPDGLTEFQAGGCKRGSVLLPSDGEILLREVDVPSADAGFLSAVENL